MIDQWQIHDLPEVGTQLLEWGVQIHDFAKFSQKLHEIERISTTEVCVGEGEGGV